MPTQLEQFTVYVPPQLLERLKAAAQRDGRTLSSFAARQLATVIDASPLGAAIRQAPPPPKGGRQVDIAEAIAAAVKRGPKRPAKGK